MIKSAEIQQPYPLGHGGRWCIYSYGGMLSAYMRFKYPNIITGSIAASAPLHLLTSTLNRDFFFNAVTKDFSDATPTCETKVRQAFIELNEIAAKGAAGEFSLCHKANTPMQYTAIFMALGYFFIFVHNRDCWYSLIRRC